jgi:SAM-dependent methyltransferase
VVPDDVLWGGDYGFYTGASWVAVQAQTAYAEWVMKDYPLLCRQGVLEIACNDGIMLNHFAEAGYPTLGIDPANGPVQVARTMGLNVWEKKFDSFSALKILMDHGHQGVVIANNVIAHVADLDDFILGLSIVLAPQGVAFVEFQYLADLITGNQIDHVYHEHRQFLSLTALKTALERHGLRPHSVRQTTAQGGSLRVIISRFPHADHSVNQLLHSEEWLNDEHALAGMQGRADRIREKLRDMLWDLRGKRVAGYGASAKSATLLNWCNIGPDLIQYMVDTTPTKQGRFTPGTGIPIISPSTDSRAPDVYVMFVHNYLPEVMKQEPLFASQGGRWLVPIPTPVLI